MNTQIEARPRDRAKFGAPRLLIVGCGDVGLRIVARLHRRFRIVAVTTSAQKVPILRLAGSVPLLADLDRRASLKRLRALASRVVHLAPPPNTGITDPRSRRLSAALRPWPARLVYVSTTGVYGDHGGALIDETVPLLPQTDRARRRIDAEQQLRARGACVLRVPGIYAHDRLPLERLRAEVPALRDADDVYTNHIHADDLARIAAAALRRAKPGRTYNAVDDTCMKMGEYFDAVADRFGLRRPPRLARADLQAAVSPMQYSFMTESRRLANRRLKVELGVHLTYPQVRTTLNAMADGPGTNPDG